MATVRRTWITELGRRLQLTEALLGIGEPTEGQFYGFLAHWFSWYIGSPAAKNADAVKTALEEIKDGRRSCGAQTFSEMTRYLYSLFLPYVAEDRVEEFNARTKRLWRQALAGRLCDHDPQERQLRQAFDE